MGRPVKAMLENDLRHSSQQTPSPHPRAGRKQLEKLEQHMVVVGGVGVRKQMARFTLLTPHTLSLLTTAVFKFYFFLPISVPKEGVKSH